MAQNNPALQGQEHPAHEGDCRLIKFLPVRYALTSEKTPPLDQENALVKECCPVDVFLTIPKDAPPVQPPYKYTLRALRSGFVHIFFPKTQSWQTWGCTGELFDYQGEKLSYIPLQSCWEEVYVAYSEHDWSSKVKGRYAGNIGKAPKRLHHVMLKSPESNTETYCFSGDSLDKLVEEYRKTPGLLRILPEYEWGPAIRGLFYPDDSKLDDVSNVERRWRFSAVEMEQRSPDKLKECLVAALADPAGMAQECAKLREHALHAAQDVVNWYGDTYMYAKSVEYSDGYINSAQRRVLFRKLSSQFTLTYENDIGFMDATINALTRFWGEWLNWEGNYSYSLLFQDYSILGALKAEAEDSFREWEGLFLKSVQYFGEHGSGGLVALHLLNPASGGLFILLKETLLQSPWAKKVEDGASKPPAEEEGLPEDSLGQIIGAMGPVFSYVDEKGKMQGGVKAIYAEIVKMAKLKWPWIEQANAGYSPEQQLSALLTFRTMEAFNVEEDFSPENGMQFTPELLAKHLFEYSQDREKSPLRGDLFDRGLAFIEGGMKQGPEFMSLYKAVDVALTAAGGIKIGPLELFRKAVAQELTPSGNAVMGVIGGTISSVGLTTAIYELATKEEGKCRNLLMICYSSSCLAESILQINSSPLAAKLPRLLQKGLPFKTATEAERFLQRRVTFTIVPVLRNAIYRQVGKAISSVLGVALSFHDACVSINKGAYMGFIGNIGLCIAIIFAGFFGWVPAVIIGVISFIMILAGEPDRVVFRLERGYFGEESDAYLPGLFKEIEDAYPSYNGTVARFSYKGGTVPANALDQSDAPRKSSLLGRRLQAIYADLAINYLCCQEIDVQVAYHRISKAYSFFITANNVTPSAKLIVHEAFLLLNGKDTYDLTDTLHKKDLWCCGYKEDKPCWFCTIPSPHRQGAGRRKFTFTLSFIGVPVQTPESAIVGGEVAGSAINPQVHLDLEDAEYILKNPTFKREKYVRKKFEPKKVEMLPD